MKKFLVSVAGLAMLMAPLAASAQSYGHGRDGGGWNSGERHSDYARGYDRDRGDGGAALAAGVLGLVLGSALASSHNDGYGQSYGYNQSYGYAQPYGYSGYPQSYGYAQPYSYSGYSQSHGYAQPYGHEQSHRRH